MNTRSLKIGSIILACVVLLMSVVTGVVGAFSIRTMRYVVEDSQYHSFEAISCISRAIESSRTLSAYRISIVLEAENPEGLKYQSAGVTAEMENLEASMGNYMAYIVDEEQMRYYIEAENIYYNQFKPQTLEMLHSAMANDTAMLADLLDASAHSANMLSASLGMSREITEQMLEEEYYQNIELSYTLTIVVVIVTVLAVLAAVALIVLVAMSMRTTKIQGQDADAISSEPPASSME